MVEVFLFYGRLCKLRFSGFQLRQVRIRFHIAVMELGLMVSTDKTMAVKFNRRYVVLNGQICPLVC